MMAEGITPLPWKLETVKTSSGYCHKIGPYPWCDDKPSPACIYVDECNMLIQLAIINFETGRINGDPVEQIKSETLDLIGLSQHDIDKLQGVKLLVANAKKGIVEATIDKLAIEARR